MLRTKILGSRVAPHNGSLVDGLSTSINFVRGHQKTSRVSPRVEETQSNTNLSKAQKARLIDYYRHIIPVNYERFLTND